MEQNQIIPNIEEQAMRISPYLICYFDKQDRARRFTSSGFMSRQISSYYRTRQREIIQKLVASATKSGTLRAIRKQIRKLMKQAEKEQGEQLREIGARIEALAKQAEDYGSIS